MWNGCSNVERVFYKRSHSGFGFLQGLDYFFLRTFDSLFDLPPFARDLPVHHSFQQHDFFPFLFSVFIYLTIESIYVQMNLNTKKVS